MRTIIYMLLLFSACVLPGPAWAQEAPNGTEVVRMAWEYMRGETSEAVTEMIIHRPDWERSMTIRGWTRGQEDSLLRIIEPPRDAGNGTLKLGSDMWTYNPKINRAIKIPPSMMSQAWMGSDFSNNDLAKSESVIEDYTHEVVQTMEADGHTAWRVAATPKPGAPVVWGKVELVVRDDGIMLEEVFFDEEGEPVKILSTEDIREMGGKLFPATWKMRKADAQDEYTLLEYESIEFDVGLPDSLFTLRSLKNPRM